MWNSPKNDIKSQELSSASEHTKYICCPGYNKKKDKKGVKQSVDLSKLMGSFLGCLRQFQDSFVAPEGYEMISYSRKMHTEEN